MITADCRCSCSRCEAQSKDIYRMVGACLNCGQRDILFLIRAGDPAPSSTFPEKCPACGNRKAYAQRLATADEVPAA